MLLWPWILLTTIWLKDGIQMSDNVARVVTKHPQRTNFFITLFANLISITVSILFSMAVVRFSRRWATNNDNITVFDISLISAFRNQNWPWEIKEHKYLLIRKRWLAAILAGVCIAAFAVVPSGTTSLITPVPFPKTWDLIGTELDFSSDPDNCVERRFLDNSSMIQDAHCTWIVSILPPNASLTNQMHLSEFRWHAIQTLSCLRVATGQCPRIGSRQRQSKT